MDNFEILDDHIHLERSISEEEKRMVIPGRRRRDRLAIPKAALSFMDLKGISKAVILHLLPGESRVLRVCGRTHS